MAPDRAQPNNCGLPTAGNELRDVQVVVASGCGPRAGRSPGRGGGAGRLWIEVGGEPVVRGPDVAEKPLGVAA
jgi:hypothetical protein